MSLIMRCAILVTAFLGLATAAAHAQVTYGMALHVTRADYSGCAGLDEATTICDAIDPTGEVAFDQFVWVLIFGANADNIPGWGAPDGTPGISAAQFGIIYDPTVMVTNWTVCAGLEIPQTDPIAWPASGTGNAIGWTDSGGCHDSPSPEDFTKCGFFTTAAGSEGVMVIGPDPRIEEGVLFADCLDFLFVIPPMNYESGADVGGTAGGGWVTCTPMSTPVHETTWSGIKSAYVN